MNHTIAPILEILAGFIVIGTLSALFLLVVASLWIDDVWDVFDSFRTHKLISTAVLASIFACSLGLSGLAAALRAKASEVIVLWFIGCGVMGMLAVVLFSMASNGLSWDDRRQQRRAAAKQRRARYNRDIPKPPDDDPEFLRSISRRPKP